MFYKNSDEHIRYIGGWADELAEMLKDKQGL